MKWITRKDIKVDRVACPWLIRRFVDPEAEFLFVAENELLDAALREQAIPFDAADHAEALARALHVGSNVRFRLRSYSAAPVRPHTTCGSSAGDSVT